MHTVISIPAVPGSSAGPVQVMTMEVVGTVQGADAQRSPPGSVSGWDLGTCSLQKALEGLYPPSFHWQGKGMNDKSTISSRWGIQIIVEQPQSLPVPPSSQDTLKKEPLGAAPCCADRGVGFTKILRALWDS